jgi:hypothetical protein
LVDNWTMVFSNTHFTIKRSGMFGGLGFQYPLKFSVDLKGRQTRGSMAYPPIIKHRDGKPTI